MISILWLAILLLNILIQCHRIRKLYTKLHELESVNTIHSKIKTKVCSTAEQHAINNNDAIRVHNNLVRLLKPGLCIGCLTRVNPVTVHINWLWQIWTKVKDGIIHIEAKIRNIFRLLQFCIPYIGNFSRGFNFRWVRDLPDIAKNRHSEN